MPFPTGWVVPSAGGRGLRAPSGRGSLRFFAKGVTTANFEDSAFSWIEFVTANPYIPFNQHSAPIPGPVVLATALQGGAPSGGGQAPTYSPPIANPLRLDLAHLTQEVTPLLYAGTIRIFNDGANLIEISFDGETVHGEILSTDEPLVYRTRHEAGISLRFPAAGAASAFRIEAW